MILEQPAEIRGMFSSLPGGAVLQQYVDELEEKNGLVRSTPDAAPQADYEEETRAKILATALAEANNQHHTPLRILRPKRHRLRLRQPQKPRPGLRRKHRPR